MKQSFAKLHSARSGFSLIEVVLALAIVAIGMVTILGLFPQGITAARNASDDSLCAMIAQDTVASRKIDIQTGVSTIGAGGIASRWFTPDGKETNSANAATAMYKCEIRATTVPGIANVENTLVRIVWPWFAANTATKSPPNTNTFITEIAVY